MSDTAGGDVDLALVASALADRTRARMVLALTDGRALPASVLADEAGVRPSTASEHLRTLLDAGLLAVRTHGRFRYYRLAGTHVADAVEALGRLAPPVQIRSLREGTRAQAMRTARCCYDHLAGRLGVAVADALIGAGHLVGGDGTPSPDRLVGRDSTLYRVTESGRAELGRLGVDVDTTAPVRCCVDWTEQRHHVGGALGRALLTTFLDRGWLRRVPSGRALRITDEGREALRAREWSEVL